MTTTPAFYTATFLMGLASGLIPFVINLEIYILGVAALSHASAAPIVGCAAAGQLLAKFLLYQAGRGAFKFRFVRWERRAAAVSTLEKYRGHSLAVVALSSLTGLPPLYGVSLAAGAMALPLGRFLVIVALGRIARFTVVFLAPAWLHLKR